MKLGRMYILFLFFHSISYVCLAKLSTEYNVFFPSVVFLLDIHGSQDNRTWGSLILPLLYHFQPLHEYFGINQLITAESSPLLIASNRIQSRSTMKVFNSLRPRGTVKKIRSYKLLILFRSSLLCLLCLL